MSSKNDQLTDNARFKERKERFFYSNETHLILQNLCTYLK